MKTLSKSKKIYRKAVFIVVYKINFQTKKPKYLLLKRKLHWHGWEFPKGGIEKDESTLEAVKREVKEETGFRAIKIKSYNVHGRYLYSRCLADRQNVIGQSYILFSSQIKEGKIKLDKIEHSDFIWLPFKKALARLTWSNQKKCLKIVNSTLK